MGIVPRVAQQHRLAAAATAVGATVPTVSVTTVTYDTSPSSVSLPGEFTAVRTAPIYARTPGYVRRRYVDIGSRVRAGQLLADIDAPDVDQQVAQARGVVAQTQAAQQLAQANLVRWRALAVDSAGTAQEGDQMQAAFNETVGNSNRAAGAGGARGRRAGCPRPDTSHGSAGGQSEGCIPARDVCPGAACPRRRRAAAGRARHGPGDPRRPAASRDGGSGFGGALPDGDDRSRFRDLGRGHRWAGGRQRGGGESRRRSERGGTRARGAGTMSTKHEFLGPGRPRGQLMTGRQQ